MKLLLMYEDGDACIKKISLYEKKNYIYTHIYI